MKKECALCNLPAKMYCESDQANLCLSCDSEIHSANFLVAKHLRSLLCRICHSPTPWKASGAKIGSTLSVCGNCATNDEDEETDESRGENDTSDVESDEDSSSSSSNMKFDVSTVSLKRMRCEEEEEEDVDVDSQSESTSLRSRLRPFKDRKREESVISGLKKSESDLLINSLRKFHQDILSGICKQSSRFSNSVDT